MPEPMSDGRRAEIRAREQAARPGPWTLFDDNAEDGDDPNAAYEALETKRREIAEMQAEIARLTGQRDAVLSLIGQEHADAAADVQAGGPADQLDSVSVPAHDLLIAVGVLPPDEAQAAPGDVDERRRALVAAIVSDFQARHMVVCEHTQLIDFGACAGAVLAALMPPVGADVREAARLRAKLDESERVAAALRASRTEIRTKLNATLKQVEADKAALAEQRVRDLHAPTPHGYCPICPSTTEEEASEVSPCATLRALDGEEGERG